MYFVLFKILSITVADLTFITLVDSFTVYYELHPWPLGPDFCKTWMILDVTLPCVALLALLLLNVDRVMYTYKNHWYQQRMTQTKLHLVLLFTPWCVSCTVVCSLWLGFPAVEPLPDVCIYGITLEAHAASSLLTVFLPSMIILVLLIFVFIAVIGEMPAVSHLGSIQLVAMSPVANAGAVNEDVSSDSSSRNRSVHAGPNATVVRGSLTNNSRAKRQRRFVTALLAVDFVSLAITLPFSAFSLVSPKCDPESCDSLMTLFQTLSWMRSSVTCVRPLLFLLLTDIYTFFKETLVNLYMGQADSEVENFTQENPNELLILTRIINRNYSVRSRNNSTSTTVIVTPPQSPFCSEPPVKSKVCTTFSTAMKSSNDVTFL
ncbi:hypothetical protein Btru_065636 [Bulinus truncatus]|nr:hypothetical protein Btru_065636 [Bulinus truncatus]